MILSFVFMILMWASIITPGGLLWHCIHRTAKTHFNLFLLKSCATYPDAERLKVVMHTYLGYALIVVTHVTFVMGWIRPLKKLSLRNSCATFHAILGHILPFLSRETFFN